MSEQQLRITLVRSLIGHPQRQRAVAKSLRLTRMHRSVVHADRPEIRGMARRIAHLVRVEEIVGGDGSPSGKVEGAKQ